jgi:hypothetical protein
MQFGFGSGVFWGTPLQDATGAAIANPTPSQLGVLQDMSLDISFDTKQLYGQNQFPVAIGRAKGKMSMKAKVAQLHGRMVNDLIFGQTLSNGIRNDVYDTTGAAIPSTPYQITPTVPGSGTWSADLGVRNTSGLPLTRVAASPATGQYSVAAGLYTFAAADTGNTVFINYQYTATSTSATKSTVLSLPMGYAPTFKADIFVPYSGKALVLTIPQCVVSKFNVATKQDDFLVPELDIEGFADSAGNALYWALSE